MTPSIMGVVMEADALRREIRTVMASGGITTGEHTVLSQLHQELGARIRELRGERDERCPDMPLLRKAGDCPQAGARQRLRRGALRVHRRSGHGRHGPSGGGRVVSEARPRVLDRGEDKGAQEGELMTGPYEDGLTDIDIRMDSRRNSIGDLSELYDILYAVDESGVDDGWSIDPDSAEPRVHMVLVDVSDSQIETIRTMVDRREWDGPRPIVDGGRESS